MSQTERGGRADTRTAVEIPATAKKQEPQPDPSLHYGRSRRCRRCGREIQRRRAVSLGYGWRCEREVGDQR